MTKLSGGILKKGDVINDTYSVQCFIGQGAFGEVYRVKHKYLGQQVLKVFKPEYVESSDIDTITKEALILSHLTHSNIVRVFETNIFKKKKMSCFFLTMGFVSGESLAQLLKRKISLSVQVSCSIQLAFLKGLATVHKNDPPIIHRDISPDNILLSYDTEKAHALLSDFGLAQSIDQVSHLSDAAGKLLYFAPECFWGVYLPASDVFSAGIVFYRMITGCHPWNYDFDNLDSNDSENFTTMIIKSRKKEPLPPSYYNEECDEEIDRIILKSLSKELESRYQNANEFLSDLLVEGKKTKTKLKQEGFVEQLYY